ncbi:MAG: hypothetical protein PHH54_03405 [Candidatus Nanoarchaeia archaeon]|nr:hypothetical protein [Candidatus Nanoarchaeia archaeon]MDD5741004.1 hypothetical protein [Candidatus Nanoarchaeia archaeon]
MQKQTKNLVEMIQENKSFRNSIIKRLDKRKSKNLPGEINIEKVMPVEGREDIAIILARCTYKIPPTMTRTKSGPYEKVFALKIKEDKTFRLWGGSGMLGYDTNTIHFRLLNAKYEGKQINEFSKETYERIEIDEIVYNSLYCPLGNRMPDYINIYNDPRSEKIFSI